MQENKLNCNTDKVEILLDGALANPELEVHMGIEFLIKIQFCSLWLLLALVLFLGDQVLEMALSIFYKHKISVSGEDSPSGHSKTHISHL